MHLRGCVGYDQYKTKILYFIVIQKKLVCNLFTQLLLLLSTAFASFGLGVLVI